MSHFSSQLSVSSQEAPSAACQHRDNRGGHISGSSSQKWVDISHWCDLVALQEKEKQSQRSNTGGNDPLLKLLNLCG